ncbi:hypothetical protein [Pseudomonas sp. NFX224]|uniref:hypothetical protein n=1 Tax=Pseudomonas sp. NFX224 TaxID=3402862 RepID=UPI003AFAB9EA
MSKKSYSYTDPRILALKKIRPDFAVEVLLTERLKSLGISPFRTYLNTVADIIDEEVSDSITLFDETLAWVEKEEFPNYAQVQNGIFHRRFSFASKDRVEGLGLLEFERVVIDIVRILIHVPSVNLSKRSVKSLSFEDVHAALKYRVPEVNIDTVYVTAFIDESGERKVLWSRSLAEDLYVSLQHDEIPYYHGEQLGVYSVAYSSEDIHRHAQLTITDIGNLVIDIVPDFLNG